MTKPEKAAGMVHVGLGGDASASVTYTTRYPVVLLLCLQFTKYPGTIVYILPYYIFRYPDTI